MWVGAGRDTSKEDALVEPILKQRRYAGPNAGTIGTTYPTATIKKKVLKSL